MGINTKTRLAILFAAILALGVYGTWRFVAGTGAVTIGSTGVPGADEGGVEGVRISGVEQAGTRDPREAVEQQAGPEVEMTRLRILTRTLGEHGLVALPNVRFVVQVGSSGFLFDAPFDTGLRVEGVSDHAGEAQVDVPTATLGQPKSWGHRYLEGSVSDPGYIQSTSELLVGGDPTTEAPPDDMALQIFTRVGTTLTGKVIGGDSRVAVIRAELESEDAASEVIETASSGAAGDFKLDLPWTDGSVRVYAEVDGAGTAARGGILLDPLRSPEFVQLVLHAGAELRGTLSDSSGRGIGGKKLLAVAVELDDPHASRDDLARQAVNWSRRGEGLVVAESATKWGGDFSFRGLRPGHYMLRAQLGGTEEYSLLVTDISIETGDRRHDLMLLTPTLVLSIVYPDGSPYRLTPRFRYETRESSDRGFGESGRAWRAMVNVGVVPVVDLGDDRGAPALPSKARPMGQGKYQLDVEAGRDYEVGLSTQTQPWRPTVFSIPTTGVPVEHTLVLGDPEPPGRLLLTVQDSEGIAVNIPFKIDIQDAARGWSCFSVETDGTAPWPLEVDLAAGEYRARLDVPQFSGSSETPSLNSAESSRLNSMLPHEFDFEIESGGPLELVATLEPSARDGAKVEDDTFEEANPRDSFRDPIDWRDQ